MEREELLKELKKEAKNKFGIKGERNSCICAFACSLLDLLNNHPDKYEILEQIAILKISLELLRKG